MAVLTPRMQPFTVGPEGNRTKHVDNAGGSHASTRWVIDRFTLSSKGCRSDRPVGELTLQRGTRTAWPVVGASRHRHRGLDVRSQHGSDCRTDVSRGSVERRSEHTSIAHLLITWLELSSRSGLRALRRSEVSSSNHVFVGCLLISRATIDSANGWPSSGLSVTLSRESSTSLQSSTVGVTPWQTNRRFP